MSRSLNYEIKSHGAEQEIDDPVLSRRDKNDSAE